jgi:hypothetical protein
LRHLGLLLLVSNCFRAHLIAVVNVLEGVQLLGRQVVNLAFEFLELGIELLLNLALVLRPFELLLLYGVGCATTFRYVKLAAHFHL